MVNRDAAFPVLQHDSGLVDKLKDIKPTQWYKQEVLTERLGMPEGLVSALKNDSSQIVLYSMHNRVRYLGATILNYATRSGHLDESALPVNVRYIDPVEFARTLEVKVSSLLGYVADENIPLVEEVEIEGSNDYKIDLTRLHKFKFSSVDHRKIQTMPDNELISAYKLSGKHPDYAERLLQRFTPLVMYIAEKIVAKLPASVDSDDLLVPGQMGLMEGLDRYDMTRGIKFETFVYKPIRGRMMDYLRELDMVPRLLRTQASNVQKFIDSFIEKNNEPPTHTEILARFNLTETEYDDIINLPKRGAIKSLETSRKNLDGKRMTLGDTIPDRSPNRVLSSSDTHETYDIVEANSVISRAISLLNGNERQIVELYYFEDLTLREVGVQLNLTESRVCQIHSAAIAKLQQISDLSSLIRDSDDN